jgi:26S proteasome regulatory subunit N7
VPLPWDEKLYERLTAAGAEELDAIQKEEDEAAEKAGDTEVQAARGKRAELHNRMGDKDKAIASYEALFEKTGILGTKIDIVLAIIRISLFFGDKVLAKKTIERATTLVESGGDWDRRNRLKAYTGLHLLTVRSHAHAAPLLLDSLSTFTSYELCSYSSLVIYAILAGSSSLKRVDFKAKVVDAPEIKAIVGSEPDKLSALSGQTSSGPGAGDEEMSDVQSSATPAAPVNLTTLGGQQDKEVAVDFTPLAKLVKSLYEGDYKNFFGALGEVEVGFLNQDRYLYEHRGWYVREMRLRGYQQLLQSYRVVGLQSMANDFGVTIDFLDKCVYQTRNLYRTRLTLSLGILPSSSPPTAYHAPLTASRASLRRTDPTTRTSSMWMWSSRVISSLPSCKSTARRCGYGAVSAVRDVEVTKR